MINKTKTFLLLFGVWFLDFLTTILFSIKFKGILIEVNPIAAYLHTFGFIGWALWFIGTFCLLLGFVYLAFFFKKIIEEKGIKSWGKYAVIIPLGIFILGEFITIINNIINIIKCTNL